ncbi:unnamed protein product [Didymodactylos carnosus]|uniref:Protein TEX261 n=1 Tax=Didymodactylos carnosus TaxID=1234261 RepID=A0A814LBL2_9BILA|nr:unnamed protein product [Didymodactylos carnosus]CAF3830602.1 unnamed protein product [Didymodactylos carnosus]
MGVLFGVSIRESLSTMWFMYIISWISFILIAFCLTISVAAGMYYVAELIEEYTSIAKRVIYYLLLIITILNILLMIFERQFTWTLMCIGLLSNILYFFILTSFPILQFLSPTFLSAMVLLILHHYFAFSFFNHTFYPFHEILAYFTLFVWCIPFTFVLSLSANDYLLPKYNEEKRPFNNSQDSDLNNDLITNYFSKRAKKYGLLAFMRNIQETILPTRNKQF